jgi:DNA-binding response OmpR family regulator
MRKILIVDDEESFCHLLRLNLEMRGFQAAALSDGRQALKAAQEFSPDLILLDLLMPKMNGFEVLKHLKESPKTTGIPVLILTARVDEEAKLQAAGLYDEDYVEKPVEVDVLIGRIEKVLSRYAGHRTGGTG